MRSARVFIVTMLMVLLVFAGVACNDSAKDRQIRELKQQIEDLKLQIEQQNQGQNQDKPEQQSNSEADLTIEELAKKYPDFAKMCEEEAQRNQKEQDAKIAMYKQLFMKADKYSDPVLPSLPAIAIECGVNKNELKKNYSGSLYCADNYQATIIEKTGSWVNFLHLMGKKINETSDN